MTKAKNSKLHPASKGTVASGFTPAPGGSKAGSASRVNSESDLRRQDSLKHRIAEAKIREDYIKTKHAERLYRRTLIRRQKRLQDELEYLHFPTLAGLYFDGFHIRHFLLRKEWADIFNEMEEINTRKKELDRHETWPELVKRNFWPPLVYGDIVFRTRGIYLDLPEVMRDPPRTPPDPYKAAKEDGKEGEGEGGEGEPEAGDGDGFNKRQKCVPKKFGAHDGDKKKRILNKNDYYFDEDKGAWFPRRGKDPDTLYFDCRLRIWRLKQVKLLYASDYYWDSDKGEFFLKDRSKAGVYYFDNEANVWKMRENNGPPCNGLEPRDYFFDELYSQWVYRGDVAKSGQEQNEYTWDENGKRFAKRIPITGPDDFFFDESGVGLYRTKDAGQEKDYHYDAEYGAWRKVGAEDPCTRLKPRDYYWAEGDGVYKIKDAPRVMFEYDSNNKFNRKKKLLRGKHHPSNWKWNVKTNQWELKKSTRSYFVNEILNWNPERGYDKPWQEDLTCLNMDIYNKAVAEMAQGQSQGTQQPPPAQTTDASGQPVAAAPAAPVAPVPEPAKMDTMKDEETHRGKRKLDLAIAQAKKAEREEERFKDHPSRIPLDKPDSAADFSTAEEKPPSPRVSSHVDVEYGTNDNVDIYGNPVLDKTYDRKRLRCGNLGGVVHEKELKAFFYAATSVTKPKNREEGDADDFMYIQFESDIAASAAYRTMQHADIKGQYIELSFPRRTQK